MNSENSLKTNVIIYTALAVAAVLATIWAVYEKNEKKAIKNIWYDQRHQLVNTYSKNKQKSHLKIRISVNGFFKIKDIYSTYS